MIKATLDPATRIEHMQYALKYGAAPLRERFGHGRISIVGYGPSLKDTWQDIQHPIMATSGAQAFLAERGVHSDYYVVMDPRVHKCKWLREPDPRTVYLMASVVCPFSWALLEGCSVWMWHAMGEQVVKDWIVANDPATARLKGGSEVGVAALRLAWWLGFRSFDLYGMDHTYGYAGECPNPGQAVVDYKGYQTTPQLLVGAMHLRRALRKCDHRVHGHSIVPIVSDGSEPVAVMKDGQGTLVMGGQSLFDPRAFLEELRLGSVRTEEPLTFTSPGAPRAAA